MTYEEAIKYAKCLHYPCVPNDDEFAELVNQAKTMAIEALKKQTPKKAIAKYDWYILNRWKCEECGGEVDSPMGYPVQKYPFCPHCGQAIDWSDEE